MRKIIQSLGALVFALTACSKKDHQEKLVDVVKGVPIYISSLPGRAYATTSIGLTKAKLLTPDEWVPLTLDEKQVYFVSGYSYGSTVLATESLIRQKIADGDEEEIMVNGHFEDHLTKTGTFFLRNVFVSGNRFKFARIY